jgi:hypothetical protein
MLRINHLTKCMPQFPDALPMQFPFNSLNVVLPFCTPGIRALSFFLISSINRTSSSPQAPGFSPSHKLIPSILRHSVVSLFLSKSGSSARKERQPGGDLVGLRREDTPFTHKFCFNSASHLQSPNRWPNAFLSSQDPVVKTFLSRRLEQAYEVTRRKIRHECHRCSGYVLINQESSNRKREQLKAVKLLQPMVYLHGDQP